MSGSTYFPHKISITLTTITMKRSKKWLRLPVLPLPFATFWTLYGALLLSEPLSDAHKAEIKKWFKKCFSINFSKLSFFASVGVVVVDDDDVGNMCCMWQLNASDTATATAQSSEKEESQMQWKRRKGSWGNDKGRREGEGECNNFGVVS